MPEVVATLVEEPEPGAPFGAKGVGEPPVISSTPAVVAAIRAATGAALTRVPVRPDDIALCADGRPDPSLADRPSACGSSWQPPRSTGSRRWPRSGPSTEAAARGSR